MSPQVYTLKEFISLIICALVNNPDSVEVVINEAPQLVQIRVSVAKEDAQFVCGENGQMKDSITDLVEALGLKSGTATMFELADSD